MKARHCDECKHFAPMELRGHFVLCDKGHKPRFYIPSFDPSDTSWGFKRKCADFEPITTSPQQVRSHEDSSSA